MAKFYEMPAVSPTMELGTIVAWRIKEGETFAPQSVLAEVGTDKANMEAEIFDKGVLLKHLVAEGDEVPPGYPIAIVGEAGEDISALLKEFEEKKGKKAPAGDAKPAEKAGAAAEPEAEAEAAPEREEEAEKAPAKEEKAAPAKEDGKKAAEAAPAEKAAKAPEAAAKPESKAPKAPTETTSAERTWMGKKLSPDFADPPGDIRFSLSKGRVFASPLAKAAAADLGVNVAKVKGTGPGGRVLQSDVEAAAAAPKTTIAGPARADEHIKHTPMRKTIAKRLLASHQNIPTFFLTITLDMGGFVAFREQIKARLPDVKISYNDILVACVARALRESPKVNAAWGDTEITRFGRVDIGIAVAIPDGLITPVLRGVDGLGLAQISKTTRELAGRARELKLKPEEYTGSTFTISNLGMFDIDQFTAIINPPEAAILAVGSIAQVPVVENGALAMGWRMKVTMTCDHRAIDGASGAEFLQVLRKYVEAPLLLLV